MPLARSSRRTSAFTLVELLTVIAVVALLGTIAIGAVSSAKQRANLARARSDLAAFVTALEEYKRLYGDYPQTGSLGQAPITPTGHSATLPNGTGPGVNFAQTRLFNCLTGVYGPRPTNGTWVRISGPNLLPPQFLDQKHLNGLNVQSGLPTNFLVPTASESAPPAKSEQNFTILDPWGQRYCYYYKNPNNPNQWQASSYVLYSAGPRVAANGTQTPPLNPTTGLMLPTQTAEMADNIYASP